MAACLPLHRRAVSSRLLWPCAKSRKKCASSFRQVYTTYYDERGGRFRASAREVAAAPHCSHDARGTLPSHLMHIKLSGEKHGCTFWMGVLACTRAGGAGGSSDKHHSGKLQ